ncbi:hypothetical protein ANO14919_098190 [Xylariales sp. No.14919]|nr:hypothetical protein ANO14919_098190 [Xylariales sp. No.14919]
MVHIPPHLNRKLLHHLGHTIYGAPPACSIAAPEKPADEKSIAFAIWQTDPLRIVQPVTRQFSRSTEKHGNGLSQAFTRKLIVNLLRLESLEA